MKNDEDSKVDAELLVHHVLSYKVSDQEQFSSLEVP